MLNLISLQASVLEKKFALIRPAHMNSLRKDDLDATLMLFYIAGDFR